MRLKRLRNPQAFNRTINDQNARRGAPPSPPSNDGALPTSRPASSGSPASSPIRANPPALSKVAGHQSVPKKSSPSPSNDNPFTSINNPDGTTRKYPRPIAAVHHDELNEPSELKQTTPSPHSARDIRRLPRNQLARLISNGETVLPCPKRTAEAMAMVQQASDIYVEATLSELNRQYMRATLSPEELPHSIELGQVLRFEAEVRKSLTLSPDSIRSLRRFVCQILMPWATHILTHGAAESPIEISIINNYLKITRELAQDELDLFRHAEANAREADGRCVAKLRTSNEAADQTSGSVS